MRITITRSGGLFGSPLAPAKVDTATLSRAEQQWVEALVNQAHFFELSAAYASASPQPDRFQFSVSITDAPEGAHTVKYSEEVAPRFLHELTQGILEVARKESKGKPP